MNTQYQCPGCGKVVRSQLVKRHIQNCQKQDSFFYLKKIKSLDTRNDINQIKFLYEQLELARDHLKTLIDKIENNNVGFGFNSQPININGSKHKSQFLLVQNQSEPKRNSHINSSSKDPFFYHQNEIKIVQKPKIIKIQSEKIMSIKKESMGMMQQKIVKQQEIKYPMYEHQVFPMEEQDIEDSFGSQITQCPLCKNKFYTSYDIQKLQMIEQCWHYCCKKCIKKYVEDQFVPTSGFPQCPRKDCNNKIPQHQSKQILGSKFQILQNKIMSGLTNIVECIKCKSQYDFVPGNPNDAPKKDLNGKPLKSQSAILYAEQRFVCPKISCKTQQCKQCHATPYHLGMSCKQHKSRALMKKCRYCHQPITQQNLNKSNIPALSDICNSEECQTLAKDACTKILSCSHPCQGVKNEKQCLPCLQDDCYSKSPSLKGHKGDDYCAICYSEGLIAAPSIQCGCGHIFHFHCLKKRLQVKWLTPRILFNFCVCPLCKAWLEVKQQNQLFKPIQQMKQLHDRIEKMALDRLKFQECEKDQRLTNKESPYFNKPKQYAMAIYAYFMCFKCKKPYFGGRKNCAQVMNNDQNVEGYNEKQLVCPGCCDIPIDNCPKHGNDFIEFKCKFCCSIAQWFCWGNTHFCEPCHKRQCNGDYVSKYERHQLPKCQGPGKCPIGGHHGQNGEQKMLGCAICRNYKQNSKNF